MPAALPTSRRYYFGQGHPAQTGAILLEVILALGLFVAAAAVVGSGLSRSAAEVDRLRLRTHALNLAMSTISELELGIRPLRSTTAEPFPAPFQEWTCQIDVEPIELGDSANDLFPQARAHVTVRHEEPAIVQRLVETLLVPTQSEDSAALPSAQGAARRTPTNAIRRP